MDAVKSSSEARALGARPRLAPVEAVAIAEEVASSLRHDLRNKFAAIRNAVYYIERSLTKSQMIAHDPRIARFLELVCEQLNAADGLLDQRGRNEALLQTAVEPIRLGACVKAALVRRVVPAGISVLTDLADQSEVQANSDEVMLAIDCLLDNAFEAVGLSGTVTVKTAEDPSVVRLLVEDTGPGMTEARRARALVPFSSEKPGHLGLGLNIAARIAGRLGGTLDLSDPIASGGTAWLLTIPKLS
jgi:signal transduction histidine kinase